MENNKKTKYLDNIFFDEKIFTLISFNSLMIFLYGSVRLFCANEDFIEKYVFLCY